MHARRTALLAFVLTFVVLVANFRAIGSGDTNAMEQTAAALAQHGSFVVENGEPHDPFTRAAPGGRVSIYPPLSAILAAPLFWLFGLLFDLNLNGLQVAGKLSAALLSASAVAVMAWSFARRVSAPRALGSALLFALGTSVYSTAQALWQHPAVLLFMTIAIAALERVSAVEPAQGFRAALIAALCLSLAAATRPACIPMCGILFVFLLHRNRARAGTLWITAAVPAVAVACYNNAFFGAPWRFGQGVGGRFFGSFPESIAGLLVSPARGLVILTPIALVAGAALWRAARGSAFARGLLASVVAHFSFIALWNEWHGGESFGPRLLTDLLPALFFFLPEGLAAWPAIGAVTGALSIGIQLLGGWTYDYRWERLHQRGREFDQALWSWRESPIVFAIREGVVIQGRPDLIGRRARLLTRRFVPFGPQGSSIEASASGLQISGNPRLRDIRLERGARADRGALWLAHPADALAFRPESDGPLKLHLTGFLRGVLRTESREGVTTHPMDGDFNLYLEMNLPGGEDVFVRAERGELKLRRLEIQP